jgi:membrane protein YdbS with pleckstrin-like domain
LPLKFDLLFTLPYMFHNLSIDPATLPQAKEADYHQLEPRYRLIRLLSSLIFWVFVLGGLGIATWLTPPHWWKKVVWIALPLLGVLRIGYQWFAFPYMQYALRERDILFRLGWLWKASTVVPFSRIQHAEVDQSFFERMYGLATLNVFTAGGSSSDLAIPGLKHERAKALRDFVLGRVDEEQPNQES